MARALLENIPRASAPRRCSSGQAEEIAVGGHVSRDLAGRRFDVSPLRRTSRSHGRNPAASAPCGSGTALVSESTPPIEETPVETQTGSHAREEVEAIRGAAFCIRTIGKRLPAE